jgi:hypothetical protein
MAQFDRTRRDLDIGNPAQQQPCQRQRTRQQWQGEAALGSRRNQKVSHRSFEQACKHKEEWLMVGMTCFSHPLILNYFMRGLFLRSPKF